MGKARLKQTAKFLVTVDLPTGITIPAMQEYIRESIRWEHGRGPGSIIPNLDRDSIKVSIKQVIRNYN